MDILFTYPKSSGLTSFIKKDVDILSAAHRVKLFPFDRIRQDLPFLVNSVYRHDLVFNWFCGLHALTSNVIAKILRKPSITIVGGYEVAKVQEIDYGQLTTGKNSWITIWGLRLTDLVLTVSQYNQMETLKNTNVCPAKVKMIYHGFSEDTFKRIHDIKKRDLVITIGNITKSSIIKKGLALFVQAARFLPNIDFMLIGPDVDGSQKILKSLAGSNVHFPGGVYGDNLVKLCNQAKVYVQASVHESFGCSVAESMLCGCVPVVSNRVALPEVVGDAGFVLESLDPKRLAQRIQDALQGFPAKSEGAMSRIRKSFPLSARRYKILKEIDALRKNEMRK